MKLIKTNLFVVTFADDILYLEADSLEEALEMARKCTSEFIKEVRWVSGRLYKKSTKTITVEV